MSYVSRFISFIAISLIVVLLGCSNSDSSSSDDSITFDGQAYSVIADNGLLSDGDVVSGNGSLIFNNPLPGIDSNRSYALSFSLEDDGELSLYSHSNNSLNNSIELVLTRDGNTLNASLVKGSDTEDISSAFSAIDAAEPTTLQVDIHNEEEPAHILIWTGSDFSEEAAIINTEEGYESPGNGEGTFWGLELTDASVSQASVSAPKFVEED